MSSDEGTRQAARPVREVTAEVAGLEEEVARLREENARLRALGDSLPHGALYSYRHDPTGRPRFLYVSAGIERMLGVRPEEILRDASALHDLILPEDRERLEREERRSRAAVAPFEMEIRQRRRDSGEVRWALLRSVPVRLSSGETVWDGIHVDITERKRAEEARRESDERFRAVFVGAADAILVTDPEADGRVLDANPAACRMFGYSDAEICALNRDALLETSPSRLAVGPAARAANGAATAELTFRRKDGGRFSGELASALFTDHLGRRRAVTIVRDITDRQRAESERDKLGQQRRLVLDAARMGWWHYDPATGGASYDERHGEIVGLAGPNHRAEEVGRLIHPDDLPAVRAAAQAALDPADPQRYSVEYRVRRPDGSLRWVEAHGVAVFEGEGAARRATSFVGTVADITARKQAEAELRESHARFRAVLENSLDAAYRRDLVLGRFDYLSPVIASVNGFSVEEMGAMSAEQAAARVHPDDRAALAAAHEAAARTGKLTAEYRFMAKDGHYRWLADRAVIIKDDSGRPRYQSGAVRDTTDVKKVEEELHQARDAMRERERHYRTLFEASPAGIVVLEPDGAVVEFNERAHRQLGYSREELARMSLRDIEAQESPAELEAHLRVIRETGAALFETRHRTKTGEVLDVVVDVRCIEVGGRNRLLAVWRDVTERNRAEQALRQADRNKTEFIAMLSHELRNPLAPIRNSLYILERAPAGGEQAARAKAVIQRQVGHMAKLIDDLLDVTRISRGKIQLQRAPVALGEIAQRTVEDFRPGFEAADVALELADRGGPLTVDGDRTRLAQVIGNLLQNASKFTPPRGRVRVSLDRDAERAEAVLRVADDGAGISAEMLPRLFQPFTQADHTLDRTRGGLGLGLSLVKGLVELHGGSVSVHSEGLGRGAEFCVRLPLRIGPVEAVAGEAPAPRRQPRRVLIIEDNLDAAESLRELLELDEHLVAVAHNGPEGIERAYTFRPDVVFCDIGLPGLDGYEVARAIRSVDALRGAFLVALSGYAMPEDLQRASEAGFDLHLAKPPSFEKLERVFADLPVASSRAADRV